MYCTSTYHIGYGYRICGPLVNLVHAALSNRPNFYARIKTLIVTGSSVISHSSKYGDRIRVKKSDTIYNSTILTCRPIADRR